MIKKLQIILFLFLASHSIHAQLEAASYSIKNLKVNTEYTDMSTSLWGKSRVIYTSSKNSKSIVKKSVNSRDKNKAFLETFSGLIDKDYEIRYSKKVKMKFNSSFNQSNVTFSRDLKTVYFTQNNGSKRRGTIYLKLYKASVSKKGEWFDIKELPFNSNSFSCAHPTLSDDGQKLYFSSNMSGGFGKSDIYVVDILGENSYGKPKNLGGYVNSAGRDNFPEINNGLLYFSSDRIGGLGGLDVYMVPTQDIFVKPTNVGMPINSKYDDFSFVINGKMRRGYFTSDRPQGKGGDDIYSFTQETAIKSCSQTIQGIVKDTQSDKIINNAIVNIFDEQGEWLNRFSTGSDGKFLIKLNKCEKNYKLEATKKEYSKDYTDIIYDPNKKIHQVSLFIEKDEIIAVIDEKPKEKVKLTIPEESLYLDVKSIEFLLNKYEIRKISAEELNKVVKIMKENPTLVVEFGAHTDSRGPDEWNMELSKKRAAEVVRYIVNKGIDYNRIYGKGYGETLPLNHCVNEVDCTDAEFIINRRTEFFILAK
jgi:outer membrane protein OmpA-like peptidoglycan-associated protein